MNKTKILMISDHALSTSGVAIQSKYLIEGLIKTEKYKIILEFYLPLKIIVMNLKYF